MNYKQNSSTDNFLNIQYLFMWQMVDNVQYCRSKFGHTVWRSKRNRIAFIYGKDNRNNMDVGTLSGLATSFGMVILCARSKWSKVKAIYRIKGSVQNITNEIAIINNHKIFIINSFSCAPAFDDPDNTSYVVYILTLGFVIPNITLIFTSTEVLRLHRLVCYLDSLRKPMYWI